MQFQNCSDNGFVGNQGDLASLSPSPMGEPDQPSQPAGGEWELCPKENVYSSASFYPHTAGGAKIDIGPLRNGTVMTLKMVVQTFTRPSCGERQR